MIPSSSTSGLSYKDRRSHQKRRSRLFLVVLLVLAIYLVFSTFVLQSWKIGAESMAPAYGAGTRVLVSPFIFTSSEKGLRRNPKRGDVVVISPPFVETPHWRFRVMDPVVRLLTFQRGRVRPVGLKDWETDRVFKRVVGIPGDTVYLEESVALVKDAGGDFFISEFEMSGRGYDIIVPELPEGWEPQMPLSGFTGEVVLGEGEYFLLGDNRSASNDSRYWGPLDERLIRGKVVLAYWPFRSFGIPH